VLVATLGIDGEGHKHPLALIEGATENAAVVQALIDNLIERGLDPKVCRLFIIDGAKALSKVIRRTFGAPTPIQRCQIHKARNVIERYDFPSRLPGRLFASLPGSTLPSSVRVSQQSALPEGQRVLSRPGSLFNRRPDCRCTSTWT